MGEKNAFKQFTPDHLGEQTRASTSNKGKKIADKSHHHPDYVPPKG